MIVESPAAHVGEPPSSGGVRWGMDPSMHHLNHGSFGAVPDAVAAEQNRLRQEVESNPVRWFSTLPERIAEARVPMARFLGVPVDLIAFVLNASAGATVVYNTFAHRGPVDVMTTDHGYGAITMGAERLAARTGGTAHQVVVPLEAPATAVLALVTEALERHRPTLLVIDQVTSATARAFPVREICTVARELGVVTLVDGAHAPGVMPDPVVREADYWVGNLHKFACSPRGAAILCARDGGQDLFPLVDSWGTPYPYPHRFDSQGTLDLTQWLAAPFAWQYLDAAIGWDTIRGDAAALLDEGCRIVADALDGLVDDPLPDVGQPVGPMRLLGLPEPLGATHDSADALRVPFMNQARDIVAFTNFNGRGYLRLSTHAYNTIDDFTHLATVGIPLLHRWSTDLVRGTFNPQSKEES